MRDNEALNELKAAFKTAPLEKFTIHFLCPSLKTLSFTTSDDKKATYKNLRQQINLQTIVADGGSNTLDTGEGTSSSMASSNQSQKKMKVSNEQNDTDFLPEY